MSGITASSSAIATARGHALPRAATLPAIGDGPSNADRDPGWKGALGTALSTSLTGPADHPLLTAGIAVAGALVGRRLLAAHPVWGAIAGVAAGIASVAAGSAALRTMLPAASPPPIAQGVAADPDPQHLRVMTFNIRYGLGPTGYVPSQGDLDDLAASITAENPDIVLLQEVHDFRIDGAMVDQFNALVDRTGAEDGAWAPAYRTAFGSADGNAVLTFHGYRVEDARSVQLTYAHGPGPRGLADTLIRTPDGQLLHVASAHLTGDVAAERAQVAAVLADRSVPTILGGDFNDKADSANGHSDDAAWGADGLTDTFATLGVPPGDPSRTSFPHLGGIDRIYATPQLRVLDTYVSTAAPRSSDHQPLVADLQLAAG